MKTKKQLLSPSALRDPRSSKSLPQQKVTFYCLQIYFCFREKAWSKNWLESPEVGESEVKHVWIYPSSEVAGFGKKKKQKKRTHRKRQKTIKGEIYWPIFWSCRCKEHSALCPFALLRGPRNRAFREKKTKQRVSCHVKVQAPLSISLKSCLPAKGPRCHSITAAFDRGSSKHIFSPPAMRCWPHCWNWKIRKMF